ncbi:Putative carboxypeptidase YodJ [bacterium HR29]|nr:Putative carboxypeptidase YodJ [bacterium HR29]
MGDVRPLPFTVSALVLLLAACSRAGGGVEVEPVGTSSPASGGTTLTADASPSPTAGSGTLVPPSPTPPVPDPLPCGDILVPIDKEHALEPDCEPGDLVPLPAEATDGGSHLLRREAADALLRMLDAARAEGHDLYVVSAYRSYRQQEQTFQYWVSVLGETEARRTSAEPGHSEHQLGTTVDLSSATVGGQLVEEFGDTPEGRWLEQNAWRFGFALSYPRGAEGVTGYAYEPWHWRYIGPEVAARWRASGLTLREFLLREWQGR